MDEVVKHLSNILAIDWPTLIAICVLCAISAIVLKDYLANPTMIVFVYPVVFVLSVAVHYSFILGELYALKKIDQWLMWTIIASICGNIVGIALVACVGRLRDGARSSRPFEPAFSPQGRR